MPGVATSSGFYIVVSGLPASGKATMDTTKEVDYGRLVQ